MVRRHQRRGELGIRATRPLDFAAAPGSKQPMSKLIYILNGPNLNLLGKRQPDVYGHGTEGDIAKNCTEVAKEVGLTARLMQSNHEGEIVDWIHQAREEAGGIIINAAALTHTSIAVLDALNTFDGPVIEVHISQVHKRERFRHFSYVSQRADAVLAGFGLHGYVLAMRHMGQLLNG